MFADIWHYRRIRAGFFISLSSIGLFLTIILLAKQLTQFYEQNLAITAPFLTICFLTTVLLPFYLVCWVVFTRKPIPTGIRQSARFYLISQLPLLLYTILAIISQYNLIEYYPILWLKGAAISIALEFSVSTISLGIRYKRIADDHRRLSDENSASNNRLLSRNSGYNNRKSVRWKPSFGCNTKKNASPAICTTTLVHNYRLLPLRSIMLAILPTKQR